MAFLREREYEKLELIGEGTYGEVHVCRNRVTHKILAVKLIKSEEDGEGIPATCVREIKIHRSFGIATLVFTRQL